VPSLPRVPFSSTFLISPWCYSVNPIFFFCRSFLLFFLACGDFGFPGCVLDSVSDQLLAFGLAHAIPDSPASSTIYPPLFRLGGATPRDILFISPGVRSNHREDNSTKEEIPGFCRLFLTRCHAKAPKFRDFELKTKVIYVELINDTAPTPYRNPQTPFLPCPRRA